MFLFFDVFLVDPFPMVPKTLFWCTGFVFSNTIMFLVESLPVDLKILFWCIGFVCSNITMFLLKTLWMGPKKLFWCISWIYVFIRCHISSRNLSLILTNLEKWASYHLYWNIWFKKEQLNYSNMFSLYQKNSKEEILNASHWNFPSSKIYRVFSWILLHCFVEFGEFGENQMKPYPKRMLIQCWWCLYLYPPLKPSSSILLWTVSL